MMGRLDGEEDLLHDDAGVDAGLLMSITGELIQATSEESLWWISNDGGVRTMTNLE